MKAYGAFGEKKLYGKTVEGVIRSTFVVDEEGKVALAQYNVKATGHVAKLRKDLGAPTPEPLSTASPVAASGGTETRRF